MGNRKRRRQARRQEQGQGGRQGGGQGDKGARQGVVNITQYVEVGSDCTELVNQHLGGEHSRFGVIGLHTCGDLAPTSIKALLASPGLSQGCHSEPNYNRE